MRAPFVTRPGGSVSSSAGGVGYTLGRETRDALQAHARRRGLTTGRLVGHLLDAIVMDDLVDAVLDDDGPPPLPEDFEEVLDTTPILHLIRENARATRTSEDSE